MAKDARTPQAAELTGEATVSQRIQAMAGFPGGTIRVSRLAADGKTYELIDKFPANMVSEETLLRDYGGGEYQLIGFKENGELVGKPVVFRIAGASKEVRPAAPASSSSNASDALLAELIRAIRERPATPAAPPSATTDLAGIAAVMAVFAKMMPTATTPAAPPARDLKELLGELKAVREAFADLMPAAPEPAGASLIDPIFGVALDRIGRIAETYMHGRGASAAPSEAPPATPPAIAAPPTVGPETVEKYPWFALVAGHVPALVKLAEKNKAAPIYAAAFLDQLDDDRAEAYLRGRLESEESTAVFLGELYECAPECAKHPAWFKEFIETMRGILFAPPEGEDEQPAEPAPAASSGPAIVH